MTAATAKVPLFKLYKNVFIFWLRNAELTYMLHLSVCLCVFGHIYLTI